jgi:predicted LPLAT superfamily acyltransferase
MTDRFNPCAVVPSHNHWKHLPAVVASLRAQGMPVLIVDDGSAEPAGAAIAALHDPGAGVRVIRRPRNGGKGAAVIDGFRQAWAEGYSHAVQVDADGQHDPAALPRLLAAAAAHPLAMVSGKPVYDSSVPAGRRIGRWITHLWVFLETLSLRITDSMCGFRVYPLAACTALLDADQLGTGMDFDTEIMVRLFWRGVAPLMVPVRVSYPPDNTSNFRMARDNWRITRMHTRLVLTLMVRLPDILRHRPPPLEAGPSHWAGLAERGSLAGLNFVAGAHRLLGRRAVAWVLAPIVLYFFLAGSRQRLASRQYLGRVLGRQPSLAEGFRHFMDFAAAAIDSFVAWSGAIAPTAMEVSDPAVLERAALDPRGAVLVVSHHGSAELARALMAPALRQRLTILVHTRHAENYNRIIARHRPDSAGRMIQVTDIGPDTAIMLRERVERGEWVAIAGDRVPVSSADRVVTVPFLGAPAPFAQGPWLLAAVLDCPVHLLFCRRLAPGRWRLMLEPFAERVTLPRGNRAQALTAHAAAYARRLEQECRAAPWQWYNFFAFWAKPEGA